MEETREIFAPSTIERWLYRARRARLDPVSALAKQVRRDVGDSALAHPPLRAAVVEQYAADPSWSAKLQYDNLRVVVQRDTMLGVCPSYQT